MTNHLATFKTCYQEEMVTSYIKEGGGAGHILNFRTARQSTHYNSLGTGDSTMN
jgi:hypothetical protein